MPCVWLEGPYTPCTAAIEQRKSALRCIHLAQTGVFDLVQFTQFFTATLQNVYTPHPLPLPPLFLSLSICILYISLAQETLLGLEVSRGHENDDMALLSGK